MSHSPSPGKTEDHELQISTDAPVSVIIRLDTYSLRFLLFTAAEPHAGLQRPHSFLLIGFLVLLDAILLPFDFLRWRRLRLQGRSHAITFTALTKNVGNSI